VKTNLGGHPIGLFFQYIYQKTCNLRNLSRCVENEEAHHPIETKRLQTYWNTFALKQELHFGSGDSDRHSQLNFPEGKMVQIYVVLLNPSTRVIFEISYPVSMFSWPVSAIVPIQKSI